MLWTDAKVAENHEKYPITVEAIENTLANENRDFTANVTIATEAGKEFCLLSSNREKESDEIKWKGGLDVICVIRYGESGHEQEEVYDVEATFWTPDGEDHEKELEMIVATLYAWVEEKVFPNARMAVNVRNLLRVKDVQGYLEETNFPAYIRSRDFMIQP